MTLEQKLKMLTDPECFEDCRLAPRSDHRWYETEEEAKKQGPMELRHSLNGIWKFCYAPNPASAPEGFENTEFPCLGWQEIQVPGQMELQGFGVPQYTDTSYPWDGVEQVKPHEVPLEKNPTGCYVRYFELPGHFCGKRIQLHFEGVETAFFCWLNGRYIGYSEDSYTPAVFDVTDAVVPGTNKLAVEVFRFSTGSWLEDQDFWRMGGIIREVALSALPKVHMQDIDAAVDLTENYTKGTLACKVKTSAAANAGANRISWRLLDADEREVAAGAACLAGDEQKSPETSETVWAFEAEVPQVITWNASRPYLYQLVLAAKDEAGCVVEAAAQQIGFRKVEIKDAVLYMNGKRMIINGVNRHEFSGRKGRAIGEEEMEWDIRFLKQNNFNAVRTSHYPNQSRWYELCDRYGIYVMDETNLETHGTWHLQKFDYTLPGDFPKWKKACLSRAEAMLERDKNHPCIFSWSVGNESWSGQTLYDMSMYFRERDASRPVHYENVCHDRKWGGTTDFESRMYATPAMAEEYLRGNPEKPYILCEYSHAMGNSCGNLKEYTDLVEKYPSYCGGFIWDYIDQALYHKNMFGEEVLAYGGDFGDRPTDYNFCTNGLVYADRKPSPKVQEVKYLYQPYRLYPEEGQIRIESRQFLEDDTAYLLKWSVEREGKTVRFGQMPVEIKAGDQMSVPCDLSVPEDGEFVLTAALVLREETAWAPAGWEMCFGQSVIRKSANRAAEEAPEEGGEGIRILDGDTTYSVEGEDFLIQYQKKSGKLTSLKIGGKELIYDPQNTIQPNFWRAPTDNDEGNGMKVRCGFWKTASLYPDIRDVKCVKEGNRAVILASHHLGEEAVCTLKHTIHADGTIEVEEELTCGRELPEMPCFGLAWKLPAAFSELTWYGKGPEETYADRASGGKIGRYTTTPKEEIPGYVIPQECANHVETRWLTLTDADGTGIRVEGDVPFEFSALPYTCHELEAARHWYELPRPYATVLRLNQCQTGVGGDNSWGAWAHEEYIVRPENTGKFRLKIRLMKQ